jgi:hypothetical membrane protein
MNARLRIAAAVAFLAAAAVYVSAEAIAASAWTSPAYSYLENWISDLGASASPRHALMNAAFALRGVLFALGAALTAASFGWANTTMFLTAATVHAVGGTLVGLVPEDVPAPLGILHVLGALFAIGGGNVALMFGAAALRSRMPTWFPGVSVALGIAGVAALIAVNFLGAAAPRGAVERVSVYTINAWELIAGMLLVRALDPSSAAARDVEKRAGRV